MKITRVITYGYEIEDEILKEYLNEVESETEISFADFIDWVETYYYLDHFTESILDEKFEQVNDNYKINEVFLEEIKRLKEND